jgi:hypothetical protein
MVIFDAQANAGKALQRFTDWLIDSAWLAEVYKQQQDLLDAEGLSPDALVELLGRACNLGFAVAEPAGWRLLPAVCRYLDHFESLALTAKTDGDEESTPAAEDWTDGCTRRRGDRPDATRLPTSGPAGQRGLLARRAAASMARSLSWRPTTPARPA